MGRNVWMCFVLTASTYIYVMVEIAPLCMADLSALVGTGALVAKAAGLGYNPTSSAVLQLLARECQLALMPTDVAWYVTSNMSSQISSR